MKLIPIVFPFIKGIKRCHFFQRLTLQMCLGNYKQQQQMFASLEERKEARKGMQLHVCRCTLFGSCITTIRKQTCLMYCISSHENMLNITLHFAYSIIHNTVLRGLDRTCTILSVYIRQVAWIKHNIFCIIQNGYEIFQCRECCVFLFY